ncbi:MAG: hypothetical protein IJ776_09660 [Paludibacteraceae bacterium]|nr:hypothetical protein [Paludibacteraceae bacterium]
MAQKIKITATDGSELIIEALGVLSQGDLEQERQALAQALAEAEAAKQEYENATHNIGNMAGLSIQIESAKNEILNALPNEATDEDIDGIFESESEDIA